ncbi:MAG TPA: hypothetical protein VF786_03390 [Terriglobales bacterium]
MRVFGLTILLFSLTLPIGAQQAQPATATFSQADAETLVRTLQDGLEGHNLNRFLSAFDRDQMIDYRDFSDQVAALFSRTDAFRVNLHVTQIEDAGDGRANVTMDAQMEITPRDSVRPDRRETTLNFQVAKSAQGWCVVDLAPREFFY